MTTNQMVTRVLRLRVIANVVVVFAMALSGATFVKLQGSLFDVQHLSILLAIPQLIKCLQFLTTKMSIRCSLFAPVILDVLYPLTLILAYYNIRSYIIISILFNAVFGILYYNRMTLITEILKKKHDINGFFNLRMTFDSIGGLLGYGLSFLVSNYISTFAIISISTGISFCIIPVLWYVNVLVIRIHTIGQRT